MNTYEDLQQANLHEIGRSECLDLLATARIGRIVLSDDEGPLALPVTFRMDGERVLFRVAPGGSLAHRLPGATVAFEVDRIDDFQQLGWSVLVCGEASFVEDDRDLPDQLSMRPVPWARGFRPVHVQVRPTRITGRRLLDD
ncbi:MAG TPA: pyridoxamine 5'-phosphate oxidase family protein [Nocardioides sp.]|nr:pyridoxamine 5'-phosphate oxidase family protein [Nocardioides sp.]